MRHDVPVQVLHGVSGPSGIPSRHFHVVSIDSYGMLWYVMVCYGMLWYVMVCYGMLWYVMVIQVVIG